jgi:S1-C subfamily serine protease
MMRHAVLLLTCLGFPAAIVACQDAPARPPGAPAPSSAPDQVQQRLESSRRTAIVDATARIAPSVVSIHVVGRRQVAQTGFFDFFFMPQQREERVDGFGTGFVLRANGIILTNQHVVGDARS